MERLCARLDYYSPPLNLFGRVNDPEYISESENTKTKEIVNIVLVAFIIYDEYIELEDL